MTKPNAETPGDEVARTFAENRPAITTVVALAIAPAIGLGIARFAYALVLPDMSSDLGWSYSDAGWMNTTNAAAYLLGALLASRAIATAGAFRVMVGGVWACIAALLFSAAVRNGVLIPSARTTKANCPSPSPTSVDGQWKNRRLRFRLEGATRGLGARPIR